MQLLHYVDIEIEMPIHNLPHPPPAKLTIDVCPIDTNRMDQLNIHKERNK